MLMMVSCCISRLDIKQSADGMQEVPGLVEAPICSIDGVWEKLKFGARNRSVGTTNANEFSSRSHRFTYCLFIQIN
jgi:kinesin family protein C2/C3